MFHVKHPAFFCLSPFVSRETFLTTFLPFFWRVLSSKAVEIPYSICYNCNDAIHQHIFAGPQCMERCICGKNHSNRQSEGRRRQDHHLRESDRRSPRGRASGCCCATSTPRPTPPPAWAWTRPYPRASIRPSSARRSPGTRWSHTRYGDVLPSNKALAGAGIELIGMDQREILLKRDAWTSSSRPTTTSSSSTAPLPWSC